MNPWRHKLLGTVLATLGSAGLLGTAPLSAGPEPASTSVNLNIAAQPLGDALTEFARQSGLQVMLFAEVSAGLSAPSVVGSYSPQAALDMLLASTDLSYEYVNERTIAIRARSAQRTSHSSVAGDTGEPAIRSMKLAQADSPSPSQGERQGEDQKASVEGTSAAGIAEILVRGSKVTNVDVTRTENDAQPYYIFDSAEIERSGAADIGHFLKQYLTMNTVAETNEQTYLNTFGAASSINLRGLGANETLVLIDGRRAASVQSSSGASSYQPDLNLIPIAAIERVEVLPSSASAIYGGAALGGVVNVILKKKYNGGAIKYSYENTTDAYAPLTQMNATYGFSLEDGRTDILLSGGYSDGKQLLMRDRLNLVQRARANISRNNPSFLRVFGFAPPLGATPNISSADGGNLVLKNEQVPLDSAITFVPTSAAPGDDIDSGLLANAGDYNFNFSPGYGQNGLNSQLGTVPLNKSLMASVRRELTPWLETFAEASIGSSETRFIDSTPADTPYFVPADAPTNPFEQDVFITIPSGEKSPLAITKSTTKSMTAGLLFHLPKEWNAGLDYTLSRSSYDSKFNEYDESSFGTELASGNVNPFVDPIVHPINVNKFLAPFTATSDSTLNNMGVRFSGPVKAVAGLEPTLTVGLDHREEIFEGGRNTAEFPLLPPERTRDIKYFRQPQRTDSIYTEMLIPLVTMKSAVPMVRSLELQLAGRMEKYTINAGTKFVYLSPDSLPDPPQNVRAKIEFTSTNPTIGIKYKPITALTFRTSYAEAFLPPTVTQLLPDPRVLNFNLNVIDPETGLSYGGVDTIEGGNPELKPQTSRTWNFGVIFEPQQELLKGLRVNLERYDIVQDEYIVSTPSVEEIISNPIYASRVTRGPVTGFPCTPNCITVVDLTAINALKYKTAGWDLSLAYERQTHLGKIRLRAAGTRVQYDKRQFTIGGSTFDYAGYPAERGSVKNKANLTLGWERHAWSLGWSSIYYSGYPAAYASGSPGDSRYGFNGTYTFFTDAQGGTVPSQIYHDFHASYDFGQSHLNRGPRAIKNMLSDLTIQLGIKNVFNKLPPFDVNFLAPYYYSPFGDFRLRSYKLSATKSF